jgi:hypothetical protein
MQVRYSMKLGLYYMVAQVAERTEKVRFTGMLLLHKYP